MKVLALDMTGVKTVVATKIKTNEGDYYAVTHGEEGKGKWQVRIPMAINEFPVEEGKDELALEYFNFKIIKLQKKDPKGNHICLLTKSKRDSETLILWNLNPGLSGGSQYEIEGEAEIIMKGRVSQDEKDTTRTDCPVVLVTGPCVLKWIRYGHLYGTPKFWEAVYDGKNWKIKPTEQFTITRKHQCFCGNVQMGFDCVCKHVKTNPGDTEFNCEYCGIYSASIPKCNKCEAYQ